MGVSVAVGVWVYAHERRHTPVCAQAVFCVGMHGRTLVHAILVCRTTASGAPYWGRW